MKKRVNSIQYLNSLKLLNSYSDFKILVSCITPGKLSFNNLKHLFFHLGFPFRKRWNLFVVYPQHQMVNFAHENWDQKREAKLLWNLFNNKLGLFKMKFHEKIGCPNIYYTGRLGLHRSIGTTAVSMLACIYTEWITSWSWMAHVWHNQWYLANEKQYLLGQFFFVSICQRCSVSSVNMHL